MREKGTKGYHKLLVWQRAREFVKLLYTNTQRFPKGETFGLQGQLRRAAVSVVLTIVIVILVSSERTHPGSDSILSIFTLYYALRIRHDALGVRFPIRLPRPSGLAMTSKSERRSY